MGAVGKFVIGIAGVVFGIILLVMVVPAQFQNMQESNKLMQQDYNQLNNTISNMINLCMTTDNIADLHSCKQEFLPSIQSDCSSYASHIPACSDPRIAQISTVADTHISNWESQMNAKSTELIDTCIHLIAAGGNSQDCSDAMQSIQNSCTLAPSMQVCSDPRINQILSGSIQSQIPSPPTTLNSQNANQYTLSYLDSCMNATDASVIHICIQSAKKIQDYCNSVSSVGIGQICNDPRLQQIASMGEATTASNSIGQPTVDTTSNPTATNPCPTPSTVEVVIKKNSLGISEFSPQSINLHGGDTIIFKSADGKSHLLTSYNGSIRDWFLQNGALVDNTKTLNLTITIFNDTETNIDIFDTYDPNINVGLGILPTPSECSK